jgi:hypothetical protein
MKRASAFDGMGRHLASAAAREVLDASRKALALNLSFKPPPKRGYRVFKVLSNWEVASRQRMRDGQSLCSPLGVRSVSVLNFDRKVGAERGRGTAKSPSASRKTRATVLGDVSGLSSEAMSVSSGN